MPRRHIDSPRKFEVKCQRSRLMYSVVIPHRKHIYPRVPDVFEQVPMLDEHARPSKHRLWCADALPAPWCTTHLIVITAVQYIIWFSHLLVLHGNTHSLAKNEKNKMELSGANIKASPYRHLRPPNSENIIRALLPQTNNAFLLPRLYCCIGSIYNVCHSKATNL